MIRKYVSLILLLSWLGHASAIQPEPENVLSIYPNPAEEQLTIDLDSGNPVLPDVYIFDVTGKKVKEYDHAFRITHKIYKANLDISDLNTGIYFVKVIQGEKVYSKKLVVK